MRNVDVLIIGGGIAGTTAAETYRAGGGAGSVLIISDEAHRLYSRVLLPHAIKGKIDPEKAFLKTPDFYTEKNIGLMTGRSVVRVHAPEREAVLDDGTRLQFEKLVIAVGGKPRVWEIPGGDREGVLRLQTFDDARKVAEALTPGSPFVIVGSGFIALEFAAIAAARGLPATLLNRGPRFWASVMGPELSSAVEGAIAASGIRVRNGIRVAEAFGKDRIEGLRLSDGGRIPCAHVGVGIGLEVPLAPFPDFQRDHGIKTDAFLEAGHAGIWAAGDCAEYWDETVGLHHAVGNWTNAVAQGRHVGKALLGVREPFRLLTSYTSNVVPGANLIFMGETKMMPRAVRETRVVEAGKKILEVHRLDGRAIGAILLNCPELRAETAAQIGGTAS